MTDEALTQAIQTSPRALGDNAAAPTFIETVPKHGCRSIAAVLPVEDTVAVGAGSVLLPFMQMMLALDLTLRGDHALGGNTGVWTAFLASYVLRAAALLLHFPGLLRTLDGNSALDSGRAGQ